LCSSPLRLETWTSCCVQSVAPGSARSSTAAHSLLASLHLGSSRAAQLAAASRLLAVPLREERRAKISSKLHGSPQPPRVAPPQSVACCATRRCVAGLGRPATCIASRLVQLNAARRPTAASRHSTSEHRALRTSQHRRGIWTSRYVQSVAPSSAQICTSAHSRLASLHLRASRLVQLATASRHLDVLLRAEHRAWFSSKLHSGPQPPRVTPPRSVACCAARRCVAALERPAACRASRLVQLKAARRPTAIHVTPPRSVAPCAARHCVSRLGRPAACRASRLVQLEAAQRPTASSRHSTSERRVLRSSPLRRGSWPFRCVKSVALSSAQSCTAARSRLASLHLGASRVAQLAAASRPSAVPLRA